MRSPLNKAIALTLLLSCMPPLHARKVKVQHRTAPGDTLQLDPHRHEIREGIDSLVRLSGYDKNRDSNRESLFLTNLSESTLRGIALSINYLTLDGRQLHRRTVNVPCLVPPGETRKLDFPTWDRQNSFYFHRSRVPQRTQATPYDVTIRPVMLVAE